MRTDRPGRPVEGWGGPLRPKAETLHAMIRKKRPPRSPRPLISVRNVAGQWQAKCPCGKSFTDTRSEKALSACVRHGYSSHSWSSHDVKFH